MYSDLALRFKVIVKRLLARMGVREETGLLPVAVLIGLLTAVAAVTFHELISWLVETLYKSHDGTWLYGRGLWLLVLIPAAGGLAVGLITRYVIHTQGGHGVVDVIESVIRSRGFVKPVTAVEKILTAALTIGTGGSTGAEGPIVQIGAAISSGVGNAFAISRTRMPLLVGCGVAAGVSSIFHAPIGGVLFTLEIILRDFSARALVPVVVASVVAAVATDGIFGLIGPHHYDAIFSANARVLAGDFSVTWTQAAQFAVLGIICGLMGVALTKFMYAGERAFAPLKKLGPFKPALGGAIVGGMGVGFILFFGWMLSADKPIPYAQYPMPAFFGDGYGVIRSMLDGSFGLHTSGVTLVALLLSLLVLKMIATAVTLASGGSGGVIAPALFIGATSGFLLGHLLQMSGVDSALPNALALVGMGAVLAAVVHAPLASILIVFELTQSPGVIVPAMLAVVTAHGIARMIVPDSVYTHSLRQRGLSPEAAADMSSLRKYAVDHLPIEPVLPLLPSDPAQRALDLASETNRAHFVVTDDQGRYAGLVTQHALRSILLEDEAVPLLTVGEIMRTDVRPVRHTENLASLFDAFLAHDVDALPVGLDYDPGRTIGLVTRDSLMKHYQKHWKTG